METTVIYSDGDTLKTDVILRKWLGGQRKFIAIIEGDSLIIKKTYSLLDFSSELEKYFLVQSQSTLKEFEKVITRKKFTRILEKRDLTVETVIETLITQSRLYNVSKKAESTGSNLY